MGLVQVGKGAFRNKYVNFTPVDGCELVNGSNFYHLVVKGTPNVLYIGGAKDGEAVEDGKVKANQFVAITVGYIQPTKHQVQLVVNPALHYYGTVNNPTIVELGESLSVVALFQAKRELVLSEIEWWFRIYALD